MIIMYLEVLYFDMHRFVHVQFLSMKNNINNIRFIRWRLLANDELNILSDWSQFF
jgi:hypothetical protein